MIDLVDFGGMFISLSSIHAVKDEIDQDGKAMGLVSIEYGPHGASASFEGTAADVMRVIGEWQLRAAAPAGSRSGAQPLLASA